MRRLTTGIIAHSHRGKKNPSNPANGSAIKGFFGVHRLTCSSVTNVWIKAEKKTPSKTNGIASRTILRKKVFTSNHAGDHSIDQSKSLPFDVNQTARRPRIRAPTISIKKCRIFTSNPFSPLSIPDGSSLHYMSFVAPTLRFFICRSKLLFSHDSLFFPIVAFYNGRTTSSPTYNTFISTGKEVCSPQEPLL